MTGIKNVFITLTSVAVLAACTNIAPEIEATRTMPSTASDFNKALQAEYAIIAKMEDDEWDTDNAKYFIDKAKMAAQGKKVVPQPVKERSLPGDTGSELEAARIALVAALGATGTQKAPKDSAHAQAMFDCWIEEQSEDVQPKDIAECRSAFDKALAAVERALVPAPVAAKPAPMKPTPAREYVVYFDTDSAKIDTAAETVVRQAVADYKGRKKAKVTVVGHTDTVGDNDYNMTLSDKRADAVSMHLVDMGVSGKIIKKDRQGEASPAVTTGDNKDERKNRRVTIRVGG